MIPAEAEAALLELPGELVRAGFEIHKEFVSAEEEEALMEEIEGREWLNELSRRTQHYGWRFDYKRKACVPTTESIPALFDEMFKERLGAWWQARVQCTVNEYLPGQGIAPHVDTHAAFGDSIFALSLGSGIGLRLISSHPRTKYNVWLPRRSLISYQGEARYSFAHGIVSRKGDLVDGEWVFRQRRVSITLRHLPPPPCLRCTTLNCLPGQCECACHHCHCNFPLACDARPNGAPKFLPTRLK